MRAYAVRFTAPTGSGTFDLTVPGAGTCIGAMFAPSGALSEVSPQTNARFAFGATDGTNSRCVAATSGSGGALTNTLRYKDATNCLVSLNVTGALNGSASFSSFITDGIRLTSSGFGGAFLCEATLYFSDSAADDFYVGTGDTSSGNQTITSVGFEASFLQGFTTMQSSVGSAQDNAKLSIGFALNDGTQHSFSFYEADAATDGAPSARLDSSYFLRDIEDASTNGAVQIGSFTSSGFTATQIDSAGFEFYYVAVKCSNTVTLDLELSPDVTGSRSHTGPGGPPQFVCGFNTKIDTLRANFENDRAGAFGYWQAHSVSAQYNCAIAIEDASPAADTQSTTDNTFPFLPDDDGGTTTALIGSITSFHATGITVDYTTVDSVECYFALLAIHLEDEIVAPDPGEADFIAVDPSVGLSSMAVDGGDGIASFLGVNPVAVLGSIAITPAVAVASFLGVDPSVAAGLDVKATVTAYETRLGTKYLHGTLPVPDNWVETDLSLIDPNTFQAIPTEKHVVTRGPTGNPRVLELRARSASAAAIAASGAQTYSVVEKSTPSGEVFHNNIRIDIEADAPDNKNNKTIVTFFSRLLSASTEGPATGEVTRTIRRAGELQAPSGSRLFGYEAFITTVAGEPDVWLVEMTVHNGNVGLPGSPLGSNALHDVFFNEIRIKPIVGGVESLDHLIMHLAPTPYTSNRKLMTPNGDGSQHFIEIGGAHEYRFAVYHTSAFARASVLLNMFGFFVADHSKEKWSWSNRNTAWFGPSGTFVSQANLTNHYPYGVAWSGAGGLAAALAGGNSINLGDDGPTTPLGPFHLRGVTSSGATGGAGIIAYVGHEVVNGGSVDKLKTLMAIQSMDRDRMSGKPSGTLQGVCFVDNNQEPINPEQWDLSNCYTNGPGKFSMPGPFNRDAADQWRLLDIDEYGGLPGWYGTKMNFSPHEYSHYIRGMSATLPLIWLRNDRLAKSYMRQLAAWSRIRNFESGLGELWKDWDGTGGIQSLPGLGAGDNGGRYSGWPYLTMAVDYQIGTDTKRANYLNWYTLLITTREQGQLPYPGSGNWHASKGAGFITAFADAWTANGNAGLGPPPDVAGGTSIEISIQGLSLASWSHALNNASLRSMLSTACRGMRDFHWLPGLFGPCFISPVRPGVKVLGSAYTQQYVSGDPYGTPGGEAPDIFPPADTDNYQIPHLILAGLKADPAHSQAWSAIYTALGASTVEEAISDLFNMITSDRLKWLSGWNAVLGYLQEVAANELAVPAPAVASFGGFDPTLFFSSTTASPAAASASFLGVDPTVIVGGRVEPLDPAVFTADAADPAVVLGSISITPASAVATMLSVDPTLVFGATTATPDAGTATFLGVDPTVNLGSRTAASEPAVFEALASDPSVVLGSVAVTPGAASVSMLGVDPTTVYNSFTSTPAAAVATFLAENPLVGQSIAVVPLVGVVTFLAEDPAVLDYDTLLVSSPVSLSGSITSVYATLRGRL